MMAMPALCSCCLHQKKKSDLEKKRDWIEELEAALIAHEEDDQTCGDLQGGTSAGKCT